MELKKLAKFDPNEPFDFRPLLGFRTCWWNIQKYFGPYSEWIWIQSSTNNLQIREYNSINIFHFLNFVFYLQMGFVSSVLDPQ